MKRVLNILISFFWFFLVYNLYRNLDFFELYFYNIPLINFKIASVLARLFLCYCLTIPFLIVLKPFSKKINVVWLSISMIASVLFVVNQLTFRTFVCNCFLQEMLNGEFLFELIFTSLSLVTLTFVVLKNRNQNIGLKHKNAVFLSFSIGLTILLFILNAPDFFLFEKPLKKYDIITYKTLKEKSIDIFNELRINDQYQTVCLLIPECPFCQRASTKLSLMANKNNFTENVTYLFSGSPTSVPIFIEKYQIENIKYQHINGEDLLHLSMGTIPAVLIIKNDTVCYAFGYRDMDETIFKDVYF